MEFAVFDLSVTHAASQLHPALIGFLGVIVGALLQWLANWAIKGREYTQAINKVLVEERIEALKAGIELLQTLRKEDELGLKAIQNDRDIETATQGLHDLAESHWVSFETGAHLTRLRMGLTTAAGEIAKAEGDEAKEKRIRAYSNALRLPLEQSEHDLWGELLQAGRLRKLKTRHASLDPAKLQTERHTKRMDKRMPASRVALPKLEE